jgi:hypothetical protein
MTDSEKPILLGGYAAKRCPVRTHNDVAPLVPIPEWAPSAELQADFDAGRQFEDEVFAELARIHPGTAQLFDPGLRKGQAIAKTLAAMESGFTWAVDDPGGRLSQAKIEHARGGGPEVLEAQRWCLDYNESDVAAQAVIRDGIREMFPVGSTAC